MRPMVQKMSHPHPSNEYFTPSILPFLFVVNLMSFHSLTKIINIYVFFLQVPVWDFRSKDYHCWSDRQMDQMTKTQKWESRNTRWGEGSCLQTHRTKTKEKLRVAVTKDKRHKDGTPSFEFFVNRVNSVSFTKDLLTT